MSFSLANFLFGMVPSISIVLLMVIFKVPRKWFMKVIPTLLLIIAFYSFNTYGPRNNLSSSLPNSPKSVEITSGKEMIEAVDRKGLFNQPSSLKE